MRLTARVAGAPVSFGVYGPEEPAFPAGEVLATLAQAGYVGIDSGPLGYLGWSDELAGRLHDAGLQLAGGWVDLRYDDPDGFAADLAKLESALELFATVPVDDPAFAPRPTLACPDAYPRFLGDWPGFAVRVQEAADRVRQRGFEPVFHHHLGTYIETAEETERLLELTDISLCLDTGHLAMAGGDPVAAARDWADRIRQVHLKDADAAGFRALGRGDVDLDGVLGALTRAGYTGWIVVEQDVPPTGQDFGRIVADQRANREWLRRAGV